MGITAEYLAVAPQDLIRARTDIDHAWSLIGVGGSRPSTASFKAHLGKTWRMVLDLLSSDGRATTRDDEEPAGIVTRAVLGGASLRRERDMGYGPWPRALELEEVGAVSVALADVDPHTLRAKFDPGRKYPEPVDRERGTRTREEVFEFVFGQFQALRDFCRRAADKGYAVIVLLG